MAVVKDIARFLCALLDGIAYDVISAIYNLFYELANIIMYDRQATEALGKRIGLILGIIMLFRLAISLISYIINPDKMKDNSQGIKKIFINVGVSLLLLAFVNIIFEKAYVLQKKIIGSKIVEKVFFGEQAMVSNVDLAYMLYTGFITPNTDLLPGCENLFNATYTLTDDTCANSLSTANLSGEAKDTIKYDIMNNHDLSELFKEYSLLNAKKSGKFIFNYTPILSTISAIIVILILISFCMDTATRMIKLMFYQIIAPIPIIANMMPGKGSEIFKKWYKECINTYLSVFIRIIALNFAIFMITLITINHGDIFKNKSSFIIIFIIIGCLMFAKQLPKLIEDITGIKSDGMLLNPLKKFEEQALLGKNITGLAAGATVGTFGMLSGAGAFQGVKGAFSGLIGGKGLTETWKNQSLNNRNMRGYLAEGSTFMGRRTAQINKLLGIPTTSEIYESDVHDIDELIKDIDNEMKPLNDSISDRNAFTDKTKAMEDRAKEKIKNGEAGLISKQYLAMTNYIEELKEKFKNNIGGVTSSDIAEAEMRATHYLNDVAAYEFIDYATGLSNQITDYNEKGISTGTSTNRSAITGADEIKDGLMVSWNDDLKSMTRNATTYTYEDASGVTQTATLDSTAVSGGAAARHTKANEISGSVNADKRTKISEYNTRKQKLEQEKAEIYQRQRIAKADESAISGK